MARTAATAEAATAGWIKIICTSSQPRGDSSFVNRINFQGEIERITTARGSVDSFSVKDGHILLIALRGSNLQELYKFEAGRERPPLTRFNKWVQESRKLAEPKHLQFETAPPAL